VPPKRGKVTVGRVEGEHLQLPSACAVTDVKAMRLFVGRNARGERWNRAWNLALVGAVVVHHPDFFVAAT